MKLKFVPIIPFLAIVLVCILGHTSSNAQSTADQVWIEPIASADNEQVFAPRRLIHRVGEVQSIDDKTLVFLAKTESEAVQVAAARVIWAEPGFDDAKTIKAIETFRSGNLNPSISMLLDAITAGPAVWRAQWLSMHLWQAAFHESKYPATLELVKQIDARPLPPMIVGGLPIHWTRERLPESAIIAARAALDIANEPDRKHSATRLVAASWLLNEPRESAAVETLQRLSLQNERPLIAQLATVLLWRRTLPPEVITNRDGWNQRLARMPLTLVPGPSYLVAESLEAAGRSDDALTKYMSVALTSPRPHAVTALAKARAVDLLKQLDRAEEAAKLIGNHNLTELP